MTTVFICGEKADETFEKLFRTELTKNYRVTFFKNSSAWQGGIGYELAAADFPKYTEVKASRPVLVLKKNGKFSGNFPKDTIVIANTQNKAQVKSLEDSGLNIISCGFSGIDTVSYTSISEDRLVVSLNREITALSGKKIQPLEIPLRLQEGTDIYSLIAFTALRLLLDDFESDIGELY